MQIIEFFTTENKEHWLKQIESSDWGAGQFLAQLLRENRLKETVGETALVLMLVDDLELIAFCTYAPLDDIQPTDMTPWIGFAYTFPKHRGQRLLGQLLDYAECLATIMEKEAVYISTNHTGLYEKYNYEFLKMEKDIGGEASRVYRKILCEDTPEREIRRQKGNEYKAEIVLDARNGINPVAVCGFSCNHCFLSQWCGGCRSCFNCCSFGTLFEKGKCPNVACAAEKNIEGCYMCDELLTCKKGFYAEGNDGANACKAQAVFIQKHGKDAFFKVHDRLHEKYDFKKTQEILGESLEVGIEILEKNIL